MIVSDVIAVPFRGVGRQLQVEINRDWLGRNWPMFVGVRGPQNYSVDDCNNLLTSLHTKMASPERADMIFVKGMRGLRLTPIKQPPHALGAVARTTYFQIHPHS